MPRFRAEPRAISRRVFAPQVAAANNRPARLLQPEPLEEYSREVSIARGKRTRPARRTSSTRILGNASEDRALLPCARPTIRVPTPETRQLQKQPKAQAPAQQPGCNTRRVRDDGRDWWRTGPDCAGE